ncbi:MAG: TonB-dependent receptor [Deltaproteobacteria bacterium]|nr:TonB-dependent receptor [Deltaproteobacteria bacterium]
MNVRKIADVLNQLPGLKAGDSSVSIQGSYKVKVLLDGRPINDPTSSHGSVKFDLVSIDNIEKIEIYKGKGALKYGDDASGGVVLITTRKIDKFQGNIKFYWGNYETSSYSANCRARKQAFGIGLSAGYDYSDGYQVNGDRKKRRAGCKLEYMPENGLKMAVSADCLKDERGLSGRSEYSTPHSRKESEMASYALTVKVKGVDIETFYNDAETKNMDSDRGVDNSITVKKIGEDITSSIEFGRWGTVNYGAAFRWGEAESSRFDLKNEHSFSLFATNAVSFETLSLRLAFGLRGSSYSEFDTTVNPEARISYKKDKWSLSFNYNRTNNIPSFYQRYDKTGTKEPNPDLDMEKSDNFSLSLFTEVSGRLSGGVSLFYNRISDRITYVLGDNGIGRYENFGKVTYKGCDILINLKILNTLSLKTTYTYLKAINEDTGLWMTAKPRHRVYADLSFCPAECFSVIFNLKYEYRQYTRSDNKASVPKRTIGNIRFEYSPDYIAGRFGRVELFGEVKNLRDKNYLYGDGWLAPPRTWICGLNYRF